MFTTGWSGAPPDHTAPADLDSLGYEINDKGQFVNKVTGGFFEFYGTSDERLNEVTKEAIHECARNAVKQELQKLEVRPIFLTGPDGTDVSLPKPTGPHIPIYTTHMDQLRECDHVVVFVGEHNQDLAIYSYRELMTSGGIDRGSAVGLVKKLQDMGLGQKGEKPGLIILNPGQLVWSPNLRKAMTLDSWIAREKKHAGGAAIRIDPLQNRVRGHSNPQEHVTTVLEDVVDQITKWDARIYVVGITDGAEKFVDYMATMVPNEHRKIFKGRRVQAMAFVQPTINEFKQYDPIVNLKLHRLGRSWIWNDAPVGTTISMPESFVTTASHLEEVPETMPANIDKIMTYRKQQRLDAMLPSQGGIGASFNISERLPVGKPTAEYYRRRALTNMEFSMPDPYGGKVVHPYTIDSPRSSDGDSPRTKEAEAEKEAKKEAERERYIAEYDEKSPTKNTSFLFGSMSGEFSKPAQDAKVKGKGRENTADANVLGAIEQLEKGVDNLETTDSAVTSGSSSEEESGLAPEGLWMKKSIRALALEAAAARSAAAEAETSTTGDQSSEMQSFTAASTGGIHFTPTSSEAASIAAVTETLTRQGVQQVPSEPMPTSVEMETVSGGSGHDAVENMWAAVMDDVLKWFVEMSGKGQ